VGSGLEDWWAASRPESAVDGEVRLFMAPTEALVSSGPEGFDISGKVLPAEGLAARPPLGTRSQVKCSLQERLKEYLEALCMKVHGLTTNGKGEYLR
jgi:hypothetical protein